MVSGHVYRTFVNNIILRQVIGAMQLHIILLGTSGATGFGDGKYRKITVRYYNNILHPSLQTLRRILIGTVHLPWALGRTGARQTGLRTERRPASWLLFPFAAAVVQDCSGSSPRRVSPRLEREKTETDRMRKKKKFKTTTAKNVKRDDDRKTRKTNSARAVGRKTKLYPQANGVRNGRPDTTTATRSTRWVVSSVAAAAEVIAIVGRRARSCLRVCVSGGSGGEVRGEVDGIVAVSRAAVAGRWGRTDMSSARRRNVVCDDEGRVAVVAAAAAAAERVCAGAQPPPHYRVPHSPRTRERGARTAIYPSPGDACRPDGPGRRRARCRLR